MERFFNRYISKRNYLMHYSRLSVINKAQLRTWRERKVAPSTYLLICLVQTVATHQNLSFEDLMLEAIGEVLEL